MTEARVVDPRKLEVLQHLQCVICLDGVSETRLCPYCSRLFCDKCIQNWLTNKSSSCPNCRGYLEQATLLKGYSINQLQESIKKLFSSMEQVVHCDKNGHENQILSLFCYPCEMNICVKCWFSEDHAEHKERAVPLEEAFEHYLQNMNTTRTWIDTRKGVVDDVLGQMQKNLTKLNEEKDMIEKLHAESEKLITGKPNPTAVLEILKTERAMAELRLNHQDETELIRLDRRREFMSEATVLDFRMPEFDKTIKNDGSYQTTLLAPYGFEWKCEIKKDEGDDMSCYLTLIAGKPSEYSVLYNDEPEKVCRFDLNSPGEIGTFKPAANVENDTQKLTVKVRQSYGDRFQQLQDYIARLEKENADHVAFRTYIAEWDKKSAPSSG